MRYILQSLLVGFLLSCAGTSQANNTLNWSASSDILTLDPYSSLDGRTGGLLRKIYDSLVERNNDVAISAVLAVSWSMISPLVWEFKLRKNVFFHEGQSFDADDVAFSFRRATSEKSDYQDVFANIESVEVVDSHTVRFHTKISDPILPNELTTFLIMDEGWAKENGLAEVTDFKKDKITKANGTGPFRVTQWIPSEVLKLQRNTKWWDEPNRVGNIDTVNFYPITSDEERVGRLLSGDLDLVVSLPPAFKDKVNETEGIRTIMAPEIRSIFLGMKQSGEKLLHTPPEQGNPLSDIRVRQAMRLSLDMTALKETVMNGLSYPAGMIIAPGVLGHDPLRDLPEKPDLDQARTLLKEAGYPDGFDLQLDCPNDRYIKDSEICQWVADELKKVNIRVKVNAQPRSKHFPLIQNRETDFYLLGWSSMTLDSDYVFRHLLVTDGTWNGTGYSNHELDKLITQLATESNLVKRTAVTRKMWDVVDADNPYLPVHHQVILWAAQNDISVPASSDNYLRLDQISK